MPEKTMKNGKSIILLRSFSLLLALLSVLLVALPASAASYAPNAAIVDYVDFVDSVTVENDMDIVSMKFPDNYCWSGVYDSELGKYQYQRIGNYVRFPALSYSFLSPVFMPLGWHNTRRLSLVGIPDGTTFRFRYFVDYETTEDVTAILGDRKINSRISYWDSAGNYLSEQITDSVGFDGPVGYVSVVLSDIPENAASCHFQVEFWSVVTPNNDEGYITLTLDDFTLSMNLSAMQVQSDMTLKQSALLKEISTNQQVTNEKLESIKDLQQQTNDKLDGVQDSIDELPGEIGDEIQGVIDNEKAEAESEGNKFVDQILDALPDPSTEVLGALKSLTDSTAYTGTDAVLPIPAIVLPGIDGLFPETEIWGGTDFDFGEYIELLPPTLLTLVQALFTIAIVIFCVYELKGIISYCLTLRENKGG